MSLLTKTIRQIVASNLSKEQMFNELKGIPEHKELVEDTFKRILQHVKDTDNPAWANVIDTKRVGDPIKEHLYVTSPDKLATMHMYGKGMTNFQKSLGSHYGTNDNKIFYKAQELIDKPWVVPHETQHKAVQEGSRGTSLVYDVFNDNAVVIPYSNRTGLSPIAEAPQLAGSMKVFDALYGGFSDRSAAVHETDAMLTEAASAYATKGKLFGRPKSLIDYMTDEVGPDRIKKILNFYRDAILSASPVAAGVGMYRTGEQDAQ